MKHFFTFLSLLLCFGAFSQRSADLDVKIISPLSPFAVDTNEVFDLEIMISNLGSDAITESDSLLFYIIIDGDTVQFPPQGNYEIYQNAIASGSSFTITRPMVFNSSFEGSEVSFCVAVYPQNSASPVADAVTANNKSCITVEVGEQPNVGLEDQTQLLFDIYPNPVKNMITISPNEEVTYFGVTDLSGKRLLEDINGGQSVDCSVLPEGFYYLFVETKNGAGVKKFVVQRN